MAKIKELEIDLLNGEGEISPKVIDYGDDVDESESTKERVKRYYNEMAVKNWFKDIEHFYVTKKFDIAMASEYTKENDYLNNLLKTIAQDMWYSQASKEYIMENSLSNRSWNSMIGK